MAYAVTASVVALHVVAAVLAAPGVGAEAAGAGEPASFEPLDLVTGVVWLCAGLLVTSARPGNPIGWLLLAVGTLGGLESAGSAYGLRGLEHAPDLPLTAAALSLASSLWPAAIFLPLTVLLGRYPSGQLRSRRDRWSERAALTGLAMMAVALSTSVESVDDWHPDARPAVALPEPVVGVLFVIGGPLVLGAAAFTVTCAVVRTLRARGDERVQLVLLLPTAAATALAAFFSPWESLFDVTLMLVPLAMATGVLRYGLLGIEVVIRRALLYGTLTLLVVGIYSAAVAAVSSLVPEGPAPTVVAAAFVAMALIPAQRRLQSGVDLLLYGRRRDPLTALRELGASTPDADPLQTVVTSLRQSLHLSHVAVLDTEGVVRTASGEPPETDTVSLSLRHRDVDLGTLVVTPRRGERQLADVDLRLLEGLSLYVAAVVRAVDLANDLAAAREHTVTAALTERSRLRADLHDGIGPSLTGIGLGLEAAEHAIVSDPERALALMARLREEAGRAVDDVRRIIDGLRPPVLDRLGLTSALRQRAMSIAEHGGPRVGVEQAGPLPELSPDSELAAYRIADEALTNAVRHSGATQILVRLRGEGDQFVLEIEDDGSGLSPVTRQGVGMESMHRRAAALGGSLCVHDGDGLRVVASLPAATVTQVPG